MKIEAKTEHVHEISIVADGEAFILSGRDGESISTTSIIVAITTLDDGTVRPIQTGFSAQGVALKKDGKPGRSPRRFGGGNLNRLPQDIREAVLAEADRLGVKGLREDVTKTARYVTTSEQEGER